LSERHITHYLSNTYSKHFSLHSNVGSLNLTEVDVTGVAEAFAKYAEVPNVESKGIKAHFNLDESGLLHVTAVEVSPLLDAPANSCVS
jgi:hypothetical protein